ncbi:MAG: hypothetical protein F4X98_17950 [Gammaproteobacteria bacterium]|nr:hypothetical protein [Gammaproteobacteria bacterium]
MSSGGAATQPAETMERQNALRSFGQDVATSPAVQPNPPAPDAASATPPERLTPADVLGNPDCFMRNGTGGDLAVVLVPDDDALRFAVIDESGIVFEDTLPSQSTGFPALARRPDGSVLAAFQSVAGPPLSSGSVVVYRDGQVIYENGVVRQFALAKDGSSFFAIEPMAGDVSRLVIRNLDLGNETHHDLASLETAPADGRRLTTGSYAIDNSEVVLQSFTLRWLGPDGLTDYRALSLPTDGGGPREIPPLDRQGTWQSFVSANEGYFITHNRDGTYTTSRRRFRDENGKVSEDVWSRDLVVPITGDGAWLVAQDGAGVYVLEASTGDIVFQRLWLTRPDYRVRLHDGRLVLDYPVAKPEDLARCRAEQQVESRTIGDQPDGPTERRLVDATAENACLADLRRRGLYRTVYDVYDLRTLADGSPPDHYRVEYGENPHCGSGDDPFGTLEVRDGQLVYVPRS